MEKNFDDIFESINLLHKKYSSEDYLKNLDHFNKSSKELADILEKYNIEDKNANNKKVKKIRKQKERN